MLESPIEPPDGEPWYNQVSLGSRKWGLTEGGRVQRLWPPSTGKQCELMAVPGGNRCPQFHCLHKCAEKEMWKKAEEC